MYYASRAIHTRQDYCTDFITFCYQSLSLHRKKQYDNVRHKVLLEISVNTLCPCDNETRAVHSRLYLVIDWFVIITVKTRGRLQAFREIFAH